MLEFDYHMICAVCGFIVLDIVTGFAQACANKTISSVKMRQGLWHKAAYLFAIMLAMLCEYATGYLDLGYTMPITAPVCAFICLTEVVSIVENLGRLNPDIVGSKLLDFFSLNKSRRDSDNEEAE